MTVSNRHDPTNAELLNHIERLTAMLEGQQKKISALEAQSVPAWSLQAPLLDPKAGPQSHLPSMLGRSFRGRGQRLGVGMILALILLIAPSGGAHASIANGNTAYGNNALPADTGSQNSAFGANALSSLTTGVNNTGTGYNALSANTTSNANTASGAFALYYNTAALNSALGYAALYLNSTGANDTAVGAFAGYPLFSSGAGNTTGSNNTFIGYDSGPGVSSEINNATAIGANAIVSQSNSIVLGGIGANTQKVGVGTTTPHSAFQIAKGFLQIRPITGSEPAAAQCATADDAGRLVVRTDGNINLYICNGTSWVGK